MAGAGEGRRIPNPCRCVLVHPMTHPLCLLLVHDILHLHSKPDSTSSSQTGQDIMVYESSVYNIYPMSSESVQGLNEVVCVCKASTTIVVKKCHHHQLCPSLFYRGVNSLN